MPEDRHDEDTSDPDDEHEESFKSLDTETKKTSRDKALIEFRSILAHHLFDKKLNPENVENNENKLKDMKLWGVPLLNQDDVEGTLDTVLMKFLKAKDYNLREAFKLLCETLKWREDFRPDEDVDFGPEMDNVWFSNGRDKEGRPLCYCVLGKSFLSTGEASEDYLRWRVQCLEKGIQKLNFRPGGVGSIVQIIDLKNANGSAMKEVKFVSKTMISLLHDHYPGIVHKNLIINIPSWFTAVHALNLRLLTQRSKNEFIFVKPSRVTETLLRYATIENILVQYGGLERENDAEFSTDDKVLEVNIRANCVEYIQIPVNEAGVTVTWDATVVGYDVTYKEEFIPDDDCSYKILLQEKKMGESIRNSFYIREPGKIVITIVNWSFTKKKAFYRYKTRPSVPIYAFI